MLKSMFPPVSDVNNHTPLEPLPLSQQPNRRIHANVFAPFVFSRKQQKNELCITDAFKKYAKVTALPNKEAERVATAYFKEHVCKFGIAVQV
jgi:hypothetical protein